MLAEDAEFRARGLSNRQIDEERRRESAVAIVAALKQVPQGAKTRARKAIYAKQRRLELKRKEEYQRSHGQQPPSAAVAIAKQGTKRPNISGEGRDSRAKRQRAQGTELFRAERVAPESPLANAGKVASMKVPPTGKAPPAKKKGKAAGTASANAAGSVAAPATVSPSSPAGNLAGYASPAGRELVFATPPPANFSGAAEGDAAAALMTAGATGTAAGAVTAAQRGATAEATLGQAVGATRGT
jgi:predicted component of type VI protein secretion system